MRTISVLALALSLPALPAVPAHILSAQIAFEATIRDLASPDDGVRLRAVRMLKQAPYPEAAIPLAAAVTDRIDQIQREAIAAELNIFLTERIVPSRRIGLIIEVRNTIAAERTFASGPLALNTLPVPVEVLTALVAAARDRNSDVAIDALYAFGALGSDPSGEIRQELLRACGPQVVGMLGVPDPSLRVAAARVIGRLFAPRAGDAAIDVQLGDGVILALNDRERDVRLAAMDALGALRYERAIQALTEIHQYYRRNAIGIGALDALSRIGHRASVHVFQDQLTGGTASARIRAIEGLARVGDSGFAATIRASLARERNAAVLLAESFSSVLLSTASVDPLFQALAKTALRDQALQYLIEVAPGRTAGFTRHAQDSVARVRADVADVLGSAYDRAALPIVEPMLKDADPLVVRAAERAVARLRRLS